MWPFPNIKILKSTTDTFLGGGGGKSNKKKSLVQEVKNCSAVEKWKKPNLYYQGNSGWRILMGALFTKDDIMLSSPFTKKNAIEFCE